MERVASYDIKLSFSVMHMVFYRLGDDIVALLAGGEREHIGSAVLALPRPSLRGDGTLSSTSSVLNVPGHKDEALCRLVADYLSSRLGCRVAVTGGFHSDNLSSSQIEETVTAVKESLQPISRLLSQV